MSLLVKICGLKTPDVLDVAIDAGADLAGFVFFEPSPRHVGLENARALGIRVRGRVKKVALTVDADEATFERIIDALQPDLLQLHGEETPDHVQALRRKFGIPVMKAIPVESANDLSAVVKYASVADRLLFDARAPRDATRPGGLGKPFDWTLLKNVDPGIPFMLSGGLDADNVAQALSVTRAPAVDVSSGVEKRPGEKDLEKIRAFLHAARRAQVTAAKTKVARGA